MTPRTAHAWHVQHRQTVAAAAPEGAVEALTGPTPVTLAVSAVFQLGQLSLAVVIGLGWLPLWSAVPLAFVFGTWALMARFVVLHELIHNNVVRVGRNTRTWLMRLCDLPTVSVGNYLYYRWGHIDHHRTLGVGGLEATLQSARSADFDHFYHIDTMRFPRSIDDPTDVDPPFYRKPWWLNTLIVVAVRFAINLQYVLFLPVMALRGHPNFPNRPKEFHRDIQLQAVLVLVQLGLLVAFAGWRSLVYLYLAEVFFYFPLHPYFAFFMSTHPSHRSEGACQPTTSVYAGALYSAYCLNINYHTEHHDFPEVSWLRLPALRRLGGHHYDPGSRSSLVGTIVAALDDPPTYACGDFYRNVEDAASEP